MKDMKDREIKVGDTIMYVSKPHCTPKLTEGTVIEVEDGRVKVERITVGGGWGSIQKGKHHEWDRSAKAFVPTDKPVAKTWIGYSSRCCIVSR